MDRLVVTVVADHTPMSPSARLRASAIRPRALAIWVGVVALSSPVPASGQQPTGIVSGVVYDSVAGVPLAGATVWLSGTRSVTTDSAGVFEFLGVPPGAYIPAISHPARASWMFSPLPELRVTAGEVTSARSSVRALESRREARWGAAECVGSMVTRDLLTRVPLPAAEVVVEGAGGRPSVRTNTAGEVPLCTPEGPVRAYARSGLARSRSRPLPPADGTLVPLVLYVPVTPPSRIEGVTRDAEAGTPVEGVVVGMVSSRARVISDADGRFVLAGVPPGDVTLYAQHIAYGRSEGAVLIGVGDTLQVDFELRQTPVEIAPLEVRVRSAAVDDRIRSGTRYDGLSRDEIDAVLHRVTDFPELLRSARIPGLFVEEVVVVGFTRMPFRGVCIEIARRRSSETDGQCQGMVEVYINGARVGSPEQVLQDLDPTAIEDIRLLSPIEASVEYGGGSRSRNGVLLIRTR